jgi:hypothetical protein
MIAAIEKRISTNAVRYARVNSSSCTDTTGRHGIVGSTIPSAFSVGGTTKGDIPFRFEAGRAATARIHLGGFVARPPLEWKFQKLPPGHASKEGPAMEKRF